MNLVNCNGKLLPQHEPVFTAQNRGFKYGDGVFETMKIMAGEIHLATLHFERLFTSIRLLGIDESNVTKDLLQSSILELCRLNNCESRARVRLATYRGDNNEAHFLLEANALKDSFIDWNNNGWRLGIYPFARKSCDAFANLKSANYLPYVLANLYAGENNFDECLVLNSHDTIADGSKTNLFFIKDGELFTPALNQGCVNGVMRRHIIEESKRKGFVVHQVEVSVEMLTDADEVFVTNAIQGIRWISQFQEKKYVAVQTKILYQELFINGK